MITVLSRGDGTGGFVAEIRVANGTKERDQSMPDHQTMGGIPVVRMLDRLHLLAVNTWANS